MAGDFDDVNSPEFQEALNKAQREAKKREQAKEYQPTAKEKELMLKLAQTSPKMYRDAKVGATLLLRTGDEQEKVAAQRYLDVMNQIERENPALKKTLDNPPKLSEAQQKKQDMEFLNYYAKEFPTEFKDMIKFLDFYKNSPVAQYYVGLMKEVQQNMAAPHEQEHQDNSSSGTSEPEKTDEGGNREHPDGHYDGNQGFIYLSDNMEHALKMGPTVLKEYMEQELGVEFPRDIIRHNADGGEYIPTRLLRKWFEENYLTSEQTDKIYALVDDRAAFDAKVREINDRDNYVAPTPQNEQSEEQTVTQQTAEENGDIAKLKQYAAKGNMMTDPAILREMKEKDPELYSTLQRTLREYLNPSDNLTQDDMFNAISDIARGCGLNQPGTMGNIQTFAQNVLNAAYGIDNENNRTAAEKQIELSQKENGDKVYKVSGYGTSGTIDDKGLRDGTYTVHDQGNGKYSVTYEAPGGYYTVSRTYRGVNFDNQDSIPEIMRTLATENHKCEFEREKAQEAQKRQEDIEKMRELLRNNPKKFEDVKNAYKAAMKDDAVKEQAAYYLGIIDEVEKDEATKEKVRQEKERSLKKLEKEIKRLEKQAKKMKEKGEKAKAEQLEAQAKEKRATLEQMRNDRAKARATDGARTDAAPHADRTATQTRAVEQQILDARKRGGNSMA